MIEVNEILIKQLEDDLAYANNTISELKVSVMTGNEQAQINGIMDWFDFSAVAKVFDVLEYKSITSDNPCGVANESEIRTKIRKSLSKYLLEAKRGAYNKNESTYTTSTGCFKYTYYFEHNVLEAVQLEFIVADWQTERNT